MTIRGRTHGSEGVQEVVKVLSGLGGGPHGMRAAVVDRADERVSPRLYNHECIALCVSGPGNNAPWSSKGIVKRVVSVLVGIHRGSQSKRLENLSTLRTTHNPKSDRSVLRAGWSHTKVRRARPDRPRAARP